MDQNLISVIMSVRNVENSIRISAESILSQTYPYFELLIIDDNSTDKTLKMIGQINDHRIKIIRNSKHKGLARSLNKGISISKGKYIARMDGDDVSYPERFAKQINFMESNPDIGICGTWLKAVSGNKSEIWRYPINDEEIKCSMLFNNSIAHPSIFIRKSILNEMKIVYNPYFKKSQDYDLYERLSRQTNFHNLPECLVRYDYSKTSSAEKIKYADKVRARILKRLHMPVNNQFTILHRHISELDISDLKIEDVALWFTNLLEHNLQEQLFKQNIFSKIVHQQWINIGKEFIRMKRISIDKFLSMRLSRSFYVKSSILFNSFFLPQSIRKI